MGDTRNLITMDRDPNELNAENEALFTDVFGEPDHLRSLSCTWKYSQKLFLGTHRHCYSFMSTVFGFPLALLWGIKYAITSFCMVWCCYPSLLGTRHCLFHVKKVYTLCIRCLLDPCYESIALLLSKINVTVEHNKSAGKTDQESTA